MLRNNTNNTLSALENHLFSIHAESFKVALKINNNSCNVYNALMPTKNQFIPVPPSPPGAVSCLCLYGTVHPASPCRAASQCRAGPWHSPY